MFNSPLCSTLLLFLLLVHCLLQQTAAGTTTTSTKLRPRRSLLSTKIKSVSRGRATFGFMKKVKDTVKDTTNDVVDTVKDTTNDVVDTVKDTTNDVVDTAKDTTNDVVDTVKDTTNDVVDTVKDTTNDVVDTVKDTTNDVVDKTKDLVDSVVDCITNPLECEELNPFWDLVPDCIMQGQPHTCVDLESQAEDVGKYAARLQKIASVAIYEVGGILLRIAREARDRRFEDCNQRSDTTPTPIPIGFDFKRSAPFVDVKYLNLPSCHMPGAWLETVFEVFKDCFMSDLNTLGPKVISAWKDEELFSDGVCDTTDNFAIILKLQLITDAGNGVTGSLGGGVGLAIGCDHGAMKVEMVFDYEAGVKFSVKPIPLSITLNQNVGFLKTWPTHKDEFMNDIGNLRVTLGMPKMAKWYMQKALNLVCQHALPDAVSDILCSHALPQTISVFLEPPTFDLNIQDPKFEGLKVAGMALGWSMELYEPAPGAKAVKSASKTGAVAIKSVKSNNPGLLKGSPSLAFHYGNTHIFGDIQKSPPCKGWPMYDDCQDFPCKNGGTCKDLLDAFECTCVGSFTGDTCEVATTITTYEPCKNKLDGDGCQLCDPQDTDCSEISVVKQCQSGTCTTKTMDKPNKECCTANIAFCLACNTEMSVKAYCDKFPTTNGCKDTTTTVAPPITETTTKTKPDEEGATEPQESQEPATDPTTDPTTDPATDPAMEPAMEPATDPTTEPAIPGESQKPDAVMSDYQMTASSEDASVGIEREDVSSDDSDTSTIDTSFLSQPMLIGMIVVGSMVGVAAVAALVVLRRPGRNLDETPANESNSAVIASILNNSSVFQKQGGNVIVKNPMNSSTEVTITKQPSAARRRSSVSHKV